MNQKKFTKANQASAKTFPFRIEQKKTNSNEELIHLTSSSCKTGLLIKNITLTKRAKHYELSKCAILLRPKATQLIDRYFGNETFNTYSF